MSQVLTPPIRRRAAVLLGVVPLVLLAGCGDDPSIAKADGGATTTTTTAARTTTTAIDEETTTTLVSGGDPTVPTTAEPGGDTPAQEEAADVSWGLNAANYRGRDGLRVGYACPPGGTPSYLWGTGPFTDDSSVCTAAVYAGLISVVDGGRVVIEIRPGEPAYSEGTANGVSAQSYGAWSGSFVFG